MFVYGERKIKKLIHQDFAIEQKLIFQKFDESWGEWIDVQSAEEFQDKDKIKILVQALDKSSSNDKGISSMIITDFTNK